jgi:hypothetical protein
VIKSALGSTTQKQVGRSMAHNGFWNPPDDLLLTKGGGVWNGNLPLAGPMYYVA